MQPATAASAGGGPGRPGLRLPRAELRQRRLRRLVQRGEGAAEGSTGGAQSAVLGELPGDRGGERREREGGGRRGGEEGGGGGKGWGKGGGGRKLWRGWPIAAGSIFFIGDMRAVWGGGGLSSIPVHAPPPPARCFCSRKNTTTRPQGHEEMVELYKSRFPKPASSGLGVVETI